MTHRLILIFFIIFLIFLWFSPLKLRGENPQERGVMKGQGEVSPPPIFAKHVFILDANTQQVIYAKDADSAIAPASTTKMLTALVVLDAFKLTDQITVTRSYPIGQNLGFSPGQTLTVERLLYAMLVDSANDAAEIFAEKFPGGRTAFVSAMNTKATNLKLTHTSFKNPTGLDEEGHVSSAVDLARLAQVFMSNPILARIAGTENTVIGTSGSSLAISNINELVGKVPGVLGVKTGFTDNAGQSLITYVSREGRTIVISLLGSTDRFTDTKTLIDWVYSK